MSARLTSYIWLALLALLVVSATGYDAHTEIVHNPAGVCASLVTQTAVFNIILQDEEDSSAGFAVLGQESVDPALFHRAFHKRHQFAQQLVDSGNIRFMNVTFEGEDKETHRITCRGIVHWEPTEEQRAYLLQIDKGAEWLLELTAPTPQNDALVTFARQPTADGKTFLYGYASTAPLHLSTYGFYQEQGVAMAHGGIADPGDPGSRPNSPTDHFDDAQRNVQGSSAQPSPPPSKHFVNSQANVQSPSLAQHYVDFSFDYPGNWTPDPANGTAGASNFVKFTRNDDNGATIENFAVGSFTSTGDPAADQQQLPQLLSSFEAQVNQLPGYKRLTIGEATTIDGLPGTQLTYSATPSINGKPANMFGRIVILPGPAGQTNGVTLIMLGTDVSGEIHSIADLGTKGQLPIILNSFKFGPPAATGLR